MTQVSSNLTFVTKWLFPLVWFGLLIFFIGQSLMNASAEEELGLGLLVPILMIVFGFFFFRAMVWDLADRVYDHGTYLQVRRRGVEDRIPLENIMNVSYTPMMNPPRVTLRLTKPCVFGTHVSFSPKSPTLSFGFSFKNPIAEQLMERAYAARTKRAV